VNVKFIGVLSLMVLQAVLVSAAQSGNPQPSPAPPAQTAVADPFAPHQAVVNRYCATCHNEKTFAGSLDLRKLDLAHFADDPALGEKIVRKLRAGMMPPTGSSRPDAATREALISWMEGHPARAVDAKP
jgi:cytochrome c5